MLAEIIAIGDEVLLGQIENTNAGWIARKLSAEGIKVHAMSVIPDDPEVMTQSFQRGISRSDVILITGGLGPTHDDYTKETIAKFFNLPIVFRNDLLEQVRKIYNERQLSFIDTSREQAEFPEGATPIRNQHGTAPGIWIERKGKIFVAMPGVPHEMRGMIIDFVLPRLRKLITGPKIYFRTLYFLGIIEAKLYETLDNREEILKLAKIAFLPSYNGIRMRLTTEAASYEEAQERLDRAESMVREKAGIYIIGKGEEFTREMAIAELLMKKHLKITTAESCTGGWLAKRFTDIPGSSVWFERGFVTYSNEAKNELLGVPYELIEEHGAVSPEVAKAMAEGALRASRAQVAISITGIAGPTGGTAEKPVGLVYIGYADREKTIAVKNTFGNERSVNRLRSITAALTLLMDQLGPSHVIRDSQLI